MATGAAGSTLVGEMNRLAGITAITAYKDLQGAANAYAGTSGLGVVAALNLKADANRTPNNYKGFAAVCNELAGTTGLSALAALRSIDV